MNEYKKTNDFKSLLSHCRRENPAYVMCVITFRFWFQSKLSGSGGNMPRRTARWIAALCWIGLLMPAAMGQRGGRYDAQVRERVGQVLASNKDYKNIKADVEDGIVTLSGDVVLHSVRRGLVARIHRIAHVVGVENQIVLAPPALPDNVLSGRVQTQLRDAGCGTLTIQVHEGGVVLHGTVRNRHDWDTVRELVSSTPGVKEVEVRLSIAEQ
jgi:osmotically-inducible protein OsmY